MFGHDETVAHGVHRELHDAVESSFIQNAGGEQLNVGLRHVQGGSGFAALFALTNKADDTYFVLGKAGFGYHFVARAGISAHTFHGALDFVLPSDKSERNLNTVGSVVRRQTDVRRVAFKCREIYNTSRFAYYVIFRAHSSSG